MTYQDPRNVRKALYRRLFAYGNDRHSRALMLAYLFNRLKNNQLADVVSMLDNDPTCEGGRERRRWLDTGSGPGAEVREIRDKRRRK